MVLSPHPLSCLNEKRSQICFAAPDLAQRVIAGWEYMGAPTASTETYGLNDPPRQATSDADWSCNSRPSIAGYTWSHA